MPNRREFDHLVNCKFKVEIEGVTTGAFTAVSGIEVCTDVIKFTDGNDILNRKRPGRTTYSNIVLKCWLAKTSPSRILFMVNLKLARFRRTISYDLRHFFFLGL